MKHTGVDDLVIAGVMYMHAFEDAPEFAIERLSMLCTDMYFVAHDVTSPRIWNAMIHEPKLRTIKRVQGPWTRIGSLELMMRMMDDVKPDVVLMPDDDEVLPERFTDELVKWREQWDKRVTMSFAPVQCIGDYNTILSRRFYRQAPHCKAIHWHPDISYVKGYAGWCWTSKLYRMKKYHCPYPMRHLAYVTQAQRDERVRNGNGPTGGEWPWYAKTDLPTCVYHPDLTWKEWCDGAGPYIVEISESEAKRLKDFGDVFRLLRLRYGDACKNPRRDICKVDDVLVGKVAFSTNLIKRGVTCSCGKRSARLEVARCAS